MYKNNSNQSCIIAEGAAKLTVTRKGWVVLNPESDEMPYDFAVDRGRQDNGRRLTEYVQVKSLRENNKRKRDGNRKICVKSRPPSTVGHEIVSKGGKGRNLYSYADEGIDWIVGVCVDTDVQYWYHVSDFRDLEDYINTSEVPQTEFPSRSVPSSQRNRGKSKKNTHGAQQPLPLESAA